MAKFRYSNDRALHMDVLPRITAQFFELFRSMSPARRVTSIAIALAVVVGFGAILISNGQSRYQPVLVGKSLGTGDLASAEQTLRSAGFTDVRRDGQRLLVPAQDLDRCNAALQESNALPADLGSQMLKHFESLGPFSTDRQRQQMKEALLLQELRSTIKGIPGIEDARVAVAISDRRHGWNQKPRTTANVSLKSSPGFEITPSLVNSLRLVVANMVPDLNPVDVTIFDVVRGHAYHGDQVEEPIANVSPPQGQALADQYEQQILKALAHIPDVGVAVQLEPGQEGHVNSPPRAEIDWITNRPATVEEADTHSAAFRGSIPELSNSVTPLRPSDTMKANGVRVSVSIPRDYLHRLTARRMAKSRDAHPELDSPLIEDEVTATVERIVGRLIPSTSAHNAVSVTYIDRVRGPPGGESPPLTLDQWIERARHWQIEIGCGAAVLTVIALGWLWRRPTSASSPVVSVSDVTEVVHTQVLEESDEVVFPPAVTPTVDRTAILRDEVRLLIASDSIAAATIVGQMLSEAGSTATYRESDGDRQAAILLLSLEQSLASEVLGKLSRERVEQITFAIAKAENITRDEQEQVLTSVRAAFLARPLLQPAGPETARNLLERTLEQVDVEPVQQSVDAQLEAGPFAFLHHRHPEDIQQLIRDEHPQTIALVSSQLSPPLAAQVLSCFSADMQAEILGRVSRLGPTEIEVLTDLASSLGDRIGRIPARTGGLARAASLLDEAGPLISGPVFRTLEQRDPKIAEALKDELFSFNDLGRLDDETLRIVLQQTDQFGWALALKGAPASLRQRVLASVASPLAAALNGEMKSMGPRPLSEILIVQRQIATAIRELANSDEIELPSPLPTRTAQPSSASPTIRSQPLQTRRTA